MTRKNKVRRTELPVREGASYKCEVVGLTHDGAGVAQFEGYTLFVAGALPNELVRLRVTKAKKSYGFAVLEQVLRATAERVQPPCEIFERCGGCQLQHFDYEAQLRWKRQTVVDSLARIGKLSEVQAEAYAVHATIGMDEPWRYRNKVQVPIASRSGQGLQMTERSSAGNPGVVAGFYARGTHDVIDMETCHIQHEWADQVVAVVKRAAERLGIAAYDEQTHSGCLRQVMVRVGFSSGQLMVVLVTNGRELPQAEALVAEIREQLPQTVSILQNVNSERTNVILGKETHVLWGEEIIYDAIGDVRFAISARSFYQVNPVQTQVLYEKALDYAGLSGHETVIDAYCGIGTITLFLAKRAKRVYGVEVVEEAIVDARRNAALNGIENVEFEVGEAEQVMPAWRERGVQADVVVVDPPRKGCDEQFLLTMTAMEPARIVYVSCNPATLARDVRVLVERGYRLVEVQPVDMFPQTTHVECVALLERG
jgi:23S rRNA (uracil1939-C5)-methyltransferase